jgi:hypothetical protein
MSALDQINMNRVTIKIQEEILSIGDMFRKLKSYNLALYFNALVDGVSLITNGVGWHIASIHKDFQQGTIVFGLEIDPNYSMDIKITAMPGWTMGNPNA